MGQLNNAFIKKLDISAILFSFALLICLTLLFFTAPLSANAEETEEQDTTHEQDVINDRQLDDVETDANIDEDVHDETDDVETEPKQNDEAQDEDAKSEDADEKKNAENDVTSDSDETSNEEIEKEASRKSPNKYEVGDKGQHVKELKLQLAQLGFGNFPKNPSTVYGNVTATIVKEFQAYYKLPETGKADKTTLDKINKVLNPPYQSGDRGVAIVELKQKLTKQGFGNFPSNPSIYYGSTTTKVVKDFQKSFGLKVDGIVGTETLKILNNPPENTLKGEQVVQLKKDLSLLGFGNFPKDPSTAYGNVTKSVVKEFQAYYNLSETGKADQATLDKINEVLNPPYQTGDRGVAIVELKQKLTKQGFGNFPSNPSIYYGSTTTKVVKDFQKSFGLKVDGIAGTETLKILNNPPENTLKGEQVVQLKKDLSLLGFGNFPKDPSTAYGNVTKSVVKEFQSYYKLPETGVADQVTLDKIEEVLSLPYKSGDRGIAIVELKQKLTKLGFGSFPSNPSIFYGSTTTKVVKEFQKSFDLKVDGIVDKKTLETLDNPYKNILSKEQVVQLKKDLSLLGFGSFPKNPSTVYGDVTASVVKEFQSYYKLPETGIANKATLDKINEVLSLPYKSGDRGVAIVELKQKLTKQGFGNFPKNPSIFYGSTTTKVVKEFQKAYGLKADGIADKKTLDTLDNPYEKGSRGEHVVLLKKNITKIGFGNFPKNPSAAYGNVTANVVKEVQKYYGLAQTGKADHATLIKIDEVLHSPYKKGEKGSHIRQLKKDLTSLGYGNFPSNPSTSYGTVTEGVVKEFQQSNGLVTNGIVDEVTLKKLSQLMNSNNNKIVFIDAGHGGDDPGASGNGLREKDITLDVANRVKKRLESMGYTVIMSRTTDKTVALSERTAQANKANADIFVSIHVNSGGGTGVETWMMNNAPQSKESRELASNIQNEVVKETKSRDRGVKDGNLHVNRESKMASALVELGFIDNKSDAEKLKKDSFKEKLSKGIVSGIKKYFNPN